MGKFTIIIIFFALAMLKAEAQDYLISFAGSGASTEVGSVKVDNLTKRDTLTLNGGDILHLIPPVGIGTFNSTCGTLKIYPNPMIMQSILTLIVPEDGTVVICIVDITGKTVYQISKFLSPGAHSFRVSGLMQGMYFIRVTGKNYTRSAKLISQGNLQNVASVEYISSDKNTKAAPLKSAAAIIDMPYNDGDQLLFKGVSGIYSTIVADVPTSSKTITFNFIACTDIDGSNYAIVELGAQAWMAENLNVGARIDGVLEQTNNGIIEKYCFNDDENICTAYGGLYQWDELMKYVTTEGTKGICPDGWHIPTDAEWAALNTFLGGEAVAGGKMKSTGTIQDSTGLWYEPNSEATNSSGFTGFPANYREFDGNFGELSYYGYFWSSSQFDATRAWSRYLGYNYGYTGPSSDIKVYGFSVRCLQD